VSPVKEEDASAVVEDVMARIPEHRDQALHDLQRLAADPKDNEAARRGLAWDDIRQKRYDAASERTGEGDGLESGGTRGFGITGR